MEAVDGPFVTLSESFIVGLKVSSLTRVRGVKYMHVYYLIAPVPSS